ncbi:MAG: radical SAM/SPASM domain-containing protein [Candidatus Sumerlaeia bacterium]
MIGRVAIRFLKETDLRLLWKFAWQFGWHGMRAVQRFDKSMQRDGKAFPPFVFISITNNCNLRCQGCWVTPSSPARELSMEELDAIVNDFKQKGAKFFGILGGEPLLHEGCLELFERHSDCYFQLFTNGHPLTDEVAARLRKAGNVTPLISVEGLEEVSNIRRGGNQVYEKTMNGIEACRKNKLIFGIATSICKSNLTDLASEYFLHKAIAHGAHYVWYYIYRPVGPRPNPELCLSYDEILHLRSFLVEARTRYPILIVDAYWDHEGKALCPAATGISHHISPGGDIEPCPPIQFSKENIRDAGTPTEIIQNSEFLAAFRKFSSSTTRGCVLLEAPQETHAFMKEHDARDSSGRGAVYEELAAMERRPGHDMSGDAIPEKHWAYRFAKKHWFFGFGAYG